MKRLISTILLAIVATLGAMAEDLIATLTHEGNTTMYYGLDAFKSAVDASVTGDVITLSPGFFNGQNIVNKSITVRGNGAEGPNATSIITAMRIDKPFVEDDPGLYIEGINFKEDLLLEQGSRDANSTINYNITIKKCVMKKFGGAERIGSYTDYYGVADNVTLIQCKVTNEMAILRDSRYNFVNCLVGPITYSNYDYRGSSTHHIVFNNSTVYLPTTQVVKESAHPFRFVSNNSILLLSAEGNCTILNNPSINNSIVVGYGEAMEHIFDQVTAPGSFSYSLGTTFKEVTNASGYQNVSYELVDSPLMKTPEGTDRYGMYSGATPYELTTDYPVLTTVDVDEKANNGVLNVNVSVENE